MPQSSKMLVRSVKAFVAAASTAGLLLLLSANAGAQQTTGKSSGKLQTFAPALVQQGHDLFLQNCAFCHGRDAGGGETGPDLTSSPLVASDVGGDKIGIVIRNGRPEKGMPRFNLPAPDIDALVAFIHTVKNYSDTHPGGRRRVDVADLQTGNAEEGKQYFSQHCASCHSASGDLAGIAARVRGLKLEERFLYPEHAPASVTVILPGGQTIAGTLVYRDEFTIGLRDSSGWYHSWPSNQIKFKVDDPAEAHVKLLAEYSDADIHNLMAYLQTLR